MKIQASDSAPITGTQMGAGMGEDAQTKNIKKQIARVQKQMQELASNDQISVEEKMKKRQELQKQLTELNGQLRQHQMEQRRKAAEIEKKQQQSQSESMNPNAKQQSDKAAEVVLSADAALKQAKVQDGVITKQKGRAGVLEAEIKLDSSRNRDVSAKQEELAKVEARMTEVQSSQIKNLSDANQNIKETKEKENKDKENETDQKITITEDVGERIAEETEKEEEAGKEEEINNSVSEKEKEKAENACRSINILL